MIRLSKLTSAELSLMLAIFRAGHARPWKTSPDAKTYLGLERIGLLAQRVTGYSFYEFKLTPIGRARVRAALGLKEKPDAK